MKAKQMGDFNIRYRENIFYRSDSWVPGHPSQEEKFYDVVVYNNNILGTSDTYEYVG